MTEVIIQSDAQSDIDAALAWYTEQAQGLGSRFIRELDLIFDRMQENPDQFPFVEPPVRRALLHKFPYSAYFLVENDIAFVIAVVHQKRHPDTWKRRD